VTSTGKTAEADTAYIDAGQTLRQAGHLMRKLGVGALEVRGDNGEVKGTISSDMVVRRIAAGDDPKTVGPLQRSRPGSGVYQLTRRRLLEILGSGPVAQPLDDAHDLPGASPPAGAVRAKRALRSAPVVLVRGVRMPAHAETVASSSR